MNKSTINESSITNVSNNQRTLTEIVFVTGHVTNPERAMRMVLGLGTIVGVLTGGITGEGHMFASTVLCIYLGITAIIGQDPFYFLGVVLGEKLMKGHTGSLLATTVN